MSVGSPNPKYCVHEEITDDVVDSFSFNVKNFNQKINKLTNRTGADTGLHLGGCEIFKKIVRIVIKFIIKFMIIVGRLYFTIFF